MEGKEAGGQGSGRDDRHRLDCHSLDRLAFLAAAAELNGRVADDIEHVAAFGKFAKCSVLCRAVVESRRREFLEIGDRLRRGLGPEFDLQFTPGGFDDGDFVLFDSQKMGIRFIWGRAPVGDKPRPR